jgi:cysteine desulfurase
MNGHFDHNATTPLHPAAREAWLRASEECWHNASSLYREAGKVRRKLEEARERLAELLGAEPERLVFTSGATESNNALFRTIAARSKPDSIVMGSSMEHPSVREPLLHEFPQRVRWIRTRQDSSLDYEDFLKGLCSQTPGLVSAMAANNESGTLLPWQEMARACKEHGVLFHSDASQWIGKLPSQELGLCDYVTGSGHKFGGPKGIGFLLLSSEDEALSFIRGGPQEEGRRAGTENYPGIEAMVTALEKVPVSGLPEWRDQFAEQLCVLLPGTRIIGAKAPRLWNTAMLILPRHDNRKWLTRLSDRGFAISTGSACSGGKDGSSVVLSALGATPEEMRRVVRVSSGWETTAADWRGLAAAFAEVAHDLDHRPQSRPLASQSL